MKIYLLIAVLLTTSACKSRRKKIDSPNYISAQTAADQTRNEAIVLELVENKTLYIPKSIIVLSSKDSAANPLELSASAVADFNLILEKNELNLFKFDADAKDFDFSNFNYRAVVLRKTPTVIESIKRFTAGLMSSTQGVSTKIDENVAKIRDKGFYYPWPVNSSDEISGAHIERLMENASHTKTLVFSVEDAALRTKLKEQIGALGEDWAMITTDTSVVVRKKITNFERMTSLQFKDQARLIKFMDKDEVKGLVNSIENIPRQGDGSAARINEGFLKTFYKDHGGLTDIDASAKVDTLVERWNRVAQAEAAEKTAKNAAAKARLSKLPKRTRIQNQAWEAATKDAEWANSTRSPSNFTPASFYNFHLRKLKRK